MGDGGRSMAMFNTFDEDIAMYLIASILFICAVGTVYYFLTLREKASKAVESADPHENAFNVMARDLEKAVDEARRARQ